MFNDERDLIVKQLADVLHKNKVKLEEGDSGLVFTYKDTWFDLDDVNDAMQAASPPVDRL
jgi:hypothetical protein